MFKGDKGVWMIYFFLCMISVVEVYSASSRLTYGGTHHWGPMIEQGSFLFMGFVIILFFHRIPCKWFKLAPIFLIPFAMFYLITTAFFSKGTINGVNRWASVAGINFQPSEVAKIALVIFAAYVLSKAQAEVKVRKSGKVIVKQGAIKGKRYKAFAILGFFTALFCGLIFMDNVSTAALLFAIILIMMFVARVPLDLLGKGLLCIGLVGAILVSMAFVMDEETLSKNPVLKRTVTVKHRIDRFTKSDVSQAANDSVVNTDSAMIAYLLSDKEAQSTYAAVAISNSRGYGLGPGNSIERDFLSHAESDFIYAIIIEEMGLIGALFVLMLYVSLLIRVNRIAQKCDRFFPAYLILGLGIMMVLQALMNMAVAVGAIPVTGQTLPLISKGGSSILITSFCIAIILSVSRYAEKTQEGILAVGQEGETNEYLSPGTMD